MKKMIALMGFCCSMAMAQDGLWDDEPVPQQEPAAAPAEFEEPVAEPATPIFVETEPAQAAPSEGFRFVPTYEESAPAFSQGTEQQQLAPAANDAPVYNENALTLTPQNYAAKSVQPTTSRPSKPSRKSFFAGVFASATYNDFFGTKLGLGEIEQEDGGYSVKTSGAGDLMGNFWGIGYTAGVALLFMPTDFFGVHAEVGGTYRWGQGESDMSVILTWYDESKIPEKLDLSLDFYVKQIRVDVPVMARAVLPYVGYLEAGPMASFAIYSKSRLLMDDDFGHQEFREHDLFKTFEFDAAVGIGTTRYIGSKPLDLGLRLVMGITALSDASDAPRTLQGQFNLTFWLL